MNWLLILLMISDMALLVHSRLNACIRILALQGVLLGILALAAPSQPPTLRLALIALASIVLKGLVYPHLLRRAIVEAGVQREIEPFVGFNASALCGVAMFGIALWLGSKLPTAEAHLDSMAAPAALMTMFTGLFLVVARKKALTQCLGYLTLENGIYAFGVATVGGIPALVELGLLLDAFVAVTVMGIAIYHINRQFDHIDADRLSSLKG